MAAANPPIGNSFPDGPLGVVRIEFNNVDYGKTMDNTEIEFIEDIADIFHAQNGTQPYDKIPTGQAYQLTCQFSEIDTALLAAMMRGVTASGGGKSASYCADLYRSGRDNFAKRLKVTRVQSDGTASSNLFFQLNFYKAMPMVTDPVIYGPDEQRTLNVTFYIFLDETENAFGYHGYASSVGLTPAT